MYRLISIPFFFLGKRSETEKIEKHGESVVDGLVLALYVSLSSML